jgi:5'(3')-deoxyribonucleotidase
LKVCSDFDSVLVSTEVRYCDLFNEYTGEHLQPKDLNNYDTTKVVPKQFKALAKRLWSAEELYDDVWPVEDSQSYTKMLSMNPNVELFVATVCPPNLIYKKYKYMKRTFPWIRQENIYIISKKQMLNCDVLIDDKAEQLVGGKYHKILFDMPYNRNINAMKEGMLRVYNWSEVFDEIIRLIHAREQIEELSK